MQVHMRLALAALLLTGTSVAAQSPADARAVLIAAAKNVATSEDVTKIEVADTSYARAVAVAVPPDPLAARRPTRPYSASLYAPVIRADSAFVFVIQRTTFKEGPFATGSRLTLVRRGGAWV